MARFLLENENEIEADANLVKYQIARRECEPFQVELYSLRVTELLRYAAVEHGPEVEQALRELAAVITDFFKPRVSCYPGQPADNRRPRSWWANR